MWVEGRECSLKMTQKISIVFCNCYWKGKYCKLYKIVTKKRNIVTNYKRLTSIFSSKVFLVARTTPGSGFTTLNPSATDKFHLPGPRIIILKMWIISKRENATYVCGEIFVRKIFEAKWYFVRKLFIKERHSFLFWHICVLRARGTTVALEWLGEVERGASSDWRRQEVAVTQ